MTLNCIAQKKCQYEIDESKILENKNLDSFLIALKSEKIKVYNDKKSIPTQVEKQLDCIAKNFDIANPNEAYQKGCIVEKKIPSRGLFFLAKR